MNNTEIREKGQWDRNGGALANGVEQDGARAAAQWYAIQVRKHFEKKTDALLVGKGVQTFLPLLEQIHTWTDRRKRVSVPLFPGYNFVHVDVSTESRQRVLQTAGVVAFVGPHHRPSSVPESQIASLQQILRSNADCSIRPFLHTGQRVRVRGGALDGLLGIVAEDPGRQIVISIECIQRSVAVTLQGYDLEPI